MDEILTLHKTLHTLINQFIEDVELTIEPKCADKKKVYIELFKRSASISERIRSLALNLLNSCQATGNSISKDTVKNKISHFVEDCFQQDLIECALNADYIDANPTNDDLHDILFKFCINDATSFIPYSMSCMADGSPENEMLLYNSSLIHLPCLNTLILSNVKTNHLSTEDLIGSDSALDFKNLHIKNLDSHMPETGYYESSAKGFPGPIEIDHSCSQGSNNQVCDWLAVAESKMCTSESNKIPSNILSWERQKRENIPCHLYTTELTDEEFLYNITTEDSELFRTLYSSAGVVSDAELIHDLLDLLVAIPSTTFMFDKKKQTFQMKSFTRRTKCSYESTLKFCDTFVQCGTVFQKLQDFSSSTDPLGGYIVRGLKFSIQQILCAYRKYIMSVKSYKPSFHVLTTDVLENAQLINCIGRICGITYQDCSLPELPKGLGLLSYLNQQSQLYKFKGEAVIYAVLLKYTYSSFFNFLNEWISEGICYDHFNEFQINEKKKYLDSKDELYWKFAYTEYESDIVRSVPSEIKQFSASILQCGKTVRLLGDCSAQLKRKENRPLPPPPRLSLLLSWPSVIRRNEECESYVRAVDSSDAGAAQPLSEDAALVEGQTLVKRRAVAEQVEERWNWYSHLRDSICDKSHQQRAEEEKRKWKSVQDIPSSFCYDIFSGCVFSSVGVLFSSCGYSLDQSKKALRLSKEFREAYAQILSGKSSLMPFFSNHGSALNKTLTSESADKEKDKPTWGSFVDRLLDLLVSSYGEPKEDIYSYLQMMSVRSLLKQNIFPILKMRVHLVQKDIEDFIVSHLRLKDLLACLKNTYFLQDESFSQSICKKLFKWTLSCESLESFADWVTLNDILLRAISSSSLSNVPFLDSASINILPISQETLSRNINRNKFMYFFNFEYNIDWPLNVIINKTCISKYTSIFSLILEMQYLCWLLGKIWRAWFIDAQKEVLQNSPQYRKVMLQRFDMHQFVRVLLNCVHQDLGGPLWESLEKGLSSDRMSIDALQELHHNYLQDALERCFLVGETRQLHETLDLLFDQVHKFCEAATDCTWDVVLASGAAECSHFDHLCDFYRMYLQCRKAFYDCILKMVSRTEFRKQWNVPFKQYLESILETCRKLS